MNKDQKVEELIRVDSVKLDAISSHQEGDEKHWIHPPALKDLRNE